MIPNFLFRRNKTSGSLPYISQMIPSNTFAINMHWLDQQTIASLSATSRFQPLLLLGSKSRTLYPLQGRNPGPLYILEDSCSCSTGLNVGLKILSGPCICAPQKLGIGNFIISALKISQYLPSFGGVQTFSHHQSSIFLHGVDQDILPCGQQRIDTRQC